MGVFKDLILADKLNPKYKDIASNSLSLLTNDVVSDKATFEQYKNQKRVIDRQYVNTYNVIDCDETTSQNTVEYITNPTDTYKLNSYETQIKDARNTINNNNTKLGNIINQLKVGGNAFNYNYILYAIIICLILYIIYELYKFNNNGRFNPNFFKCVEKNCSHKYRFN